MWHTESRCAFSLRHLKIGKIKKFSIILSGGPSEPVYSPGSDVEGHIVLELSAPQNAKAITVVLSGKGHVKWLSLRSNGSDSERVLAGTCGLLWGSGGRQLVGMNSPSHFNSPQPTYPQNLEK